jgi:hypothetical protein
MVPILSQHPRRLLGKEPDCGATERTQAGTRHFFSMFHMGGTDGTDITPEIRSDR